MPQQRDLIYTQTKIINKQYASQWREPVRAHFKRLAHHGHPPQRRRPALRSCAGCLFASGCCSEGERSPGILNAGVPGCSARDRTLASHPVCGTYRQSDTPLPERNLVSSRRTLEPCLRFVKTSPPTQRTSNSSSVILRCVRVTRCVDAHGTRSQRCCNKELWQVKLLHRYSQRTATIAHHHHLVHHPLRCRPSLAAALRAAAWRVRAPSSTPALSPWLSLS
jgi:hypothetical protein